MKIVSGIFIVATSIVGAIIALGFIGAIIEGAADYAHEHERCLKRATNGYEIRRCK